MRHLNKGLSTLVKILAIAFGAIYFYMSGFGVISSQMNVGLFLLFTNVICLILYPASKERKDSKIVAVLDTIFVILTAVSIIYWIYQYPRYGARVGMPTEVDIILGSALILLTIEVTRRVMGLTLTVLGILFLLQLYFGPYLPGLFGHGGFSIVRIVEFEFLTMQGIFGTVVNVFATYVMPFLIFGSFLQLSGGGDFFIKLASAIAGHLSGGPALIAVFGSGVFGSISGSPVANVVSTGSFTIPLMKKVGYTSEFAGAVEASASTGGQFLPPVMGAAAFLLATFTETPYSKVVIMAAIPALLYYLSVSCMVFFRAKRKNLQGIKREDLPDIVEVLKKGWYYIFTIILAIYLIVTGFSPPLVAFWASLFLVGASMIRKETRFSLKKLVQTFETAGRNALTVGATAGTIGIIMGSITLSGLGVKFSAMVLSLSNGNILITIVLVAIASTIIGMGLPTTASYIVLAILAAPGIIELGIPPIQAHLLCFWLSMTSNVTPPVCVAAFAAASVSGGNAVKTGYEAFFLSLFLYLMPVAFVYNPELLIWDSTALATIMTTIKFILVAIALASSVQGWIFKNISIIERSAFLISAFLLLITNSTINYFGIALFAFLVVKNFITKQETEIVFEGGENP